MNLGNVLLGGFIATLVLSTIMSASQGLGLSRMSIPFMVGTMFTSDRDRASLVGFMVHILFGWLFAFLYALIFDHLGRSTWWLGAAFGALHGLVVLLVLLPLMPGLHPRMASVRRGPEPTRDLEPPGFLALHYGRRTPLSTLLAHVVYGATLGLLYL